MNDEATPPGVITVGGLTMTIAQDQIGAALAKAQARVRKARKNARNPHLRNEYADLGDWRFTVLNADNRRIRLLQVSPASDASSETAQAERE